MKCLIQKVNVAGSVKCAPWFAVAMCVGLAACASAPLPSTPVPVALPQQFKAEGQWQPTQGDLNIASDWWLAFQDPALNTLQQQLLNNNPSIAAAQARVRVAQAALAQAQGQALPQLNLGLSSNRAKSSGSVTTFANPSGGQTNDPNAPTSTTIVTPGRITQNNALSLQMAWEVDLWGRLSQTAQAAGAQLQATVADERAATLSAQALLAQSYFQWRTQALQVQRWQSTVADLQRFVNLTQVRLQAGVASPLDEAQAQTQLGNAQAQLLEATLRQNQTENALASLLGVTPDALSLPNPTAWAWPSTQAPTLLPSTVLLNRPDVYSAERAVAAANAQIGIARAAYFPTLSLGATVGQRSNQFSTLLDSPAFFWSVGPALALSLFDGGQRNAAVERAKANLEVLSATYKQVSLAAFQEVEDNLQALAMVSQSLQVAQSNVSNAQKALRIAENQYQAGVADSLVVINAQTTLQNAQGSVIDLHNRRLQAVVQLLKNTGGLLPKVES